jgi:hypothetical protein
MNRNLIVPLDHKSHLLFFKHVLWSIWTFTTKIYYPDLCVIPAEAGIHSFL